MAGIERDADAGERFVGRRRDGRQRGTGTPGGGGERSPAGLAGGETQGVEVIEGDARLAQHGGLRVDADERFPTAVRGVKGVELVDEFLAGDRFLVRIEAAVVRQVAEGAEVLGAGCGERQQQANASDDPQGPNHGRSMDGRGPSGKLACPPPRDRDKLSSMIADIRRLIDATPFVPFTIHAANGRTFRVPMVDHIAVPPSGRPVFIFGDGNGDYEVLSPLLIAQPRVERSEPITSTET